MDYYYHDIKQRDEIVEERLINSPRRGSNPQSYSRSDASFVVSRGEMVRNGLPTVFYIIFGFRKVNLVIPNSGIPLFLTHHLVFAFSIPRWSFVVGPHPRSRTVVDFFFLVGSPDGLNDAVEGVVV